MNIERKTLTLLIIIPILYTFLFGGLYYRNTMTNVPIIICNLDDGDDSQTLIQSLYDMPDLNVIAVENSPVNIEHLMSQYQTFGAVVIPKDYSKCINTGRSINIELIVDNTNTVLGGTISRAVQSVVSTQSATIAVNQRIAAGWTQSQAQSVQLSLSSRMLYNPTNGYIDFFLSVLILHGSQIAVVFSITPMVVKNKKNSFSYVASTWLICSVIEICVIALCLAIGIGVFSMICRGSWIEILMLIAIFISSMTAFAISVGVWINETYKALLTPLVYIMPSILFANVTWTRNSMDNISLFFSYVMPIGYAADDLRNLFVKGTAANLQSHMSILLLFGLIFFMLASVGIKRLEK